MGRRKKGKKKGGDGGGDGGGDEDWEVGSEASFTSTSEAASFFSLAGGGGGDQDEDGLLEDQVLPAIAEALYEKRAATRERGLDGLCAYLRSAYRYDELDRIRETIGTLLLRSIQKGKAKEQELAAYAVALAVLTLGPDENESWQDHIRALAQKATGAGPARARVACARSLGVVCFVGSEDADLLEHCVSRLERLFTSQASELRAEAYTSLALLLSVASVPAGSKIVARVLDYAETFADALRDPAVEVRTAAGSALVVLRETFGDVLDGDGDGDGDGGDLDSVVERMGRLANAAWRTEGEDGEAGDRMNKRDRQQQRRAFRELVEAMEGKESSSKDAKLKLKHGDVLHLETHSSRVAAGVFKSVLAAGFQVHMQTNDLLHQIFDFEPRQEKIRLTQLEKKMLFSPNSTAKKKQTKARNKDRANKGNALNFYED